MTRSKIYSIVLGICLGFLGCTQAPVLKVYSLNVPSVINTEKSPYRHKIVKVTHPQSLREYISQKMNFSYSISEHGTYQDSEWSNDMLSLLQGTFIEVLENSRLFKAVLSDSSSLKENYRLESNIFAFEHRVRKEESHAIISIQFTLIDVDTGKLVKSKRFSYAEATPSIDAKGYAYATNMAMERLSKDLLRWLR